ATRLYLDFCNHLEKYGHVRASGETPDAFAQRVAKTAPPLAETVQHFTRLFNAISYAKPVETQQPERLQQMEKALRLLVKQLKKQPRVVNKT
ncbi:MAG TPA: DUF4129 domain-containing protein, partial [Pseudomonadales bacterium]|nr:DUF4129 domain-containing protein [Pseudomonadales bacterium]